MALEKIDVSNGRNVDSQTADVSNSVSECILTSHS